ncbi:hypothetical protein Cni_G03633 [Canna indica]|uniref:Protein NUCLEAR FUSION DEFECTIVE 6, chloroplastic/mitochondrial n=1 Tax=Canna indica TaxID=4628 RepID=A0AAQ3Q1Z5_9LILI|nr:hypothetical protein Cni_G03633 [Canna indica]
MASAGSRSLSRASLSSVRSYLARSKPAPRFVFTSHEPAAAAASASPSPARRFPSLSRSPVELGCCSGSLLPLHSAVAAARLTSCLSSSSRSCRDLLQGTHCRAFPGV